MNFVDSEFVAFIAIVFGIWITFREYENATRFFLLFASFFFYGFHQWQLVFLLGAYCAVDWIAGISISFGRYRRLSLAAGITFNLGALIFWKYTPLIVNSAAVIVFGASASEPPINELSWYLPIGISFYAFTGIAYMVDVYRGDTPAERDLFRFALYISFFPQLVAGPVLRAHEFLIHLQAGVMPRKSEAVTEAFLLMARGFFKKLVIADGIGRAVDPFFAHVMDSSTEGVWSLPYLYLYSLQIFFDFSAYTDLARGAGLLFGFRWPENFDRPYLAHSVRDFWRRWHITLSRFLRDYLYIPLGGGHGGAMRTSAALMTTMLLGGLWHGAAWSFMIWGGLHGFYLVLHRIWRSTRFAVLMDSLPASLRWLWKAASVLITFHLVTATWSFFRLTELDESLRCLEKIFFFENAKIFAGNSGDTSLWSLIGVYLVLAWLVPPIYHRTKERLEAACNTNLAYAVWGVAWGTVFTLILFAHVLSEPGRGEQFIYFRF